LVARRSQGFTLIELLVVLAIMAMLVLIAVPPVASVLPRMQAKSGAREIAAALREARSRAIMLNREVLFSIDVNSHSFSVSGDQHTHALPRNVDLSLYTAQRELLAPSLGGIRFFPDGTSTGGSVALSSAKSSYTVTVNWVTGRIDIVE
jgi:general secretion pathway protein H